MSTFQKYGEDFQRKALFLLFTDESFCRYMATALQPDYFDAEIHQHLAQIVFGYYRKYKSKITQEALAILLKERFPGTTAEYLTVAKEIMKIGEKAEDLQFVREETKLFCENQDIKNTIAGCVDLLDEGNYKQIKSNLSGLIRHETDFDIGADYSANADERFQKGAREVIPTPWEPINEILGGGAGKGELFVTMAPPGIGKCIDADTVIEISYDTYTYTINGKQITFPEPWYPCLINGEFVYPKNIGNKLDLPVSETVIESKFEKLTISDLFQRLQIAEFPLSELIPDFDIRVLTPAGYKRIAKLWRTEEQRVCKMLFTGRIELKCSLEHLVMTQEGWVKVKDLTSKHRVETKNGVVKPILRDYDGVRSLYDIAVEEEHCYYSNEILSHNSWTLINVSAHAALHRKNVAFYTLELNPNYVGYRFDSFFTKTPIGDLIADPDTYKGKIKDFIEQYKPPLRIKFYKRKTASVDTIKAHLELLGADGFKVDMIVIDYADLLKPTGKSEQLRFALENVYEELINLAVDYQVPVWTATQTNRSSVNQSVIGNESVAESFNKVAIADFVMSLSRTAADKGISTGRFFVSKNRYGADGLVFQTELNLACGEIKVAKNSEWVNDFEEKQTQNAKSSLRAKLKQFQTQG